MIQWVSFYFIFEIILSITISKREPVKRILPLIVLFIILISCDQHSYYEPNNLRKLSNSELVEAAEQNKTYNRDNTVYKDQFGEIIPSDSLSKTKYPCFNNFVFDKYVDEEDHIIEIVIRPATPKDLELKAKIDLAFQEQPTIEIVEIDCAKIGEILDSIYILDQGMRKNGNSIVKDIEYQLLNKVISIIEKCGMPTLNEVNEHQMMALWLVFQHSHHYVMKKYYPLLLQSAKNGDLELSQMALTEDRLLMREGKAQKYGSQIQAGCKTKWELYRLGNPETVNKRRAEVGLEPLENYLNNYGIVFNIKQLN